MLRLTTVSLAAIASLFLNMASIAQTKSYTIPMGGNTWSSPESSAAIKEEGVINWKDPASVLTTYFKTEKAGKIKLSLEAASDEGSQLDIDLAGVKKKITLPSGRQSIVPIGEFTLVQPGYQQVTLRGLSKSGATFGVIQALIVEDMTGQNTFHFVKDNKGNFFYWGRRGPSVHLNYTIPDQGNAEWFYNEITVPKGQDVIGSYYMANGFAQGYFGIQVNSATERRVLFSVWSPFNTDNPKDIPADQRIVMLKKGENVQTGEFGNEGSGGQSFLRFNWEAGKTYRFLLKARPNGDNTSTFTAYFMTPESGKWSLIASFKRPKTDSWVQRPHSFLENFIPTTGNISRHVLFGNQWICDSKGQWTELTKAVFTADNTARVGYRMDYAGGLSDGQFYLKNCGFFNETTQISEQFERKPLSKTPVIDFSKLP